MEVPVHAFDDITNGENGEPATAGGPQRRLKQRHVQMLAIAGTIGTGLFLSSGQAISGAGPVGALFAYAFVGSVAFAISVGRLRSRLCGWMGKSTYESRALTSSLDLQNYFFTNAVTIPLEISGALILLSYWNVPKPKTFVILIWGVICLVNIFGVRYFGESTSAFVTLYLPTPVTMIAVLVVMGIVIDLGGAPNHTRIGFRLAGVFIAGLIVPSNDPSLLQAPGLPSFNTSAGNNTDAISASPFVIAMKKAGINGAAISVLNAGLLTSAISAGNSFLFSASRILYGLALRGQAPSFFQIIDRRGVPMPAVLFTAAFGFLAFIPLSDVFQWFYHLAAVGILITWAIINLTYLRFYRGMVVQEINRRELKYWSRFQPWLARWGLFWCIIFTFLGGYPVFRGFSQNANRVFIVNYLIPPAVCGLFVFWRYLHRTFFWPADEMDFVSHIPAIEETETSEVRPRGFWEKLAYILF
ncbi:hypothetical protein ID866_9038 [Astraeus odoratus]|nr:hypothetical protein ID866_9038 [Astraeus odoratus]